MKRRIECRMRQADVAAAVGVCVESVTRWERDGHRPSATNRRTLVRLMGRPRLTSATDVHAPHAGFGPEEESALTVAVIAYVYEQATRHRKPPRTAPPLR